MSKIDLSKAKVGDKFRTRDGSVMKYIGYDRFLDLYIVSGENYKPYPVQKDGRFLCERECFSDLKVQVIDNENRAREPLPENHEKDIATLKRDERINLEMANVVRDIENEQQELQRRQEVVELAEKMYIMFENETLRSYLSCNGSNISCSEILLKMAFTKAASFVNKKHKYLKEGKLC